MSPTPIRYLSMDGLLNTGVSDFEMKNSELTACKNVWVYKIGKLEKVPGYDKASSAQVVNDKSVNFLHYYYDTTNNANYLIAGSDSSTAYTLRYIAPNLGSPVTNWATLTGISTTLDGYSGSQPCAENYLGKAFVVGHKTGTTFLPNFTVNGVTFSAADSDLTNMPQGKYIVRYKDLLYVLHAYASATLYPSRAYFCSTPSSMAITWTPATDFIEFGYEDGDEITGGTEALDKLLVFKHFSMWKYDESNRYKIADVGCDSHRSIVKIVNIPYWFNRDGFWRWRGGQPELISRKAQAFIDAIDQTKLTEVVAVPYNGYEYRAFIGDVTVEGITYNNAWFCWNTRSETCYIRCTYNEVKSTSMFVISGKRRAYFGDDDGYVYKFATKIDNIYSDNGQEIDSFLITKNLDSGIPEDIKTVNNITVFTRNPMGMVVVVDPDNKDEFKEIKRQVLKKNVEDFTITTEGNRLRYKFYEKSSSKSWELEGFVNNVEIKETGK